MKRGLLKLIAAIGAVIGAGFIVLVILNYYEVFDYIAFLKKADYYVYILIAIAGLFAVAELVVLFSRKPKAQRSVEAEFWEAVEAQETAADFSMDNAVEKETGLSLKSLKSAKTASDSFCETDQLRSDMSKEIVLQSPTPVELPKYEAANAAQSAVFGADWEELSRLINPDELDDIRYTGQKTNDMLDLDNEFVVRSTDEAVAPTRVEKHAQPAPQRQTPESSNARSSGDVDYIIGKINEIIDLVTEREGKK